LRRTFLLGIKLLDRHLNKLGRRLARLLGLKRRRPVIATVYRGYACANKIWLRGRVLLDRNIITSFQDSGWKTLVNNYKRFGSKEISNARLSVQIETYEFALNTDPEGYFLLPASLPQPIPERDIQWRPAKINIEEIPGEYLEEQFTAEYLVPSAQAQYGIISDIDDTVLKTDVTSIMKLRVLYHTFLKNAAKRQSFHAASAFYRCLSCGNTDSPVNPVFYVSNSPWNLYDLLVEFLDLNNLPKGPLLLRDFGIPYEEKPKATFGQKHSNIIKIFETFPHLPFVLVGDSGEKDPYIYQAVAEAYPDRVKAIYIRDVHSGRRRRRINAFIKATGADIQLIGNFAQAARDAYHKGLFSKSLYKKIRRQEADAKYRGYSFPPSGST
jgi:phosphatidate phosphatase APP1